MIKRYAWSAIGLETITFKRTTQVQTHTSTRSQQTRLAAWQTVERNLVLLERQVCLTRRPTSPPWISASFS